MYKSLILPLLAMAICGLSSAPEVYSEVTGEQARKVYGGAAGCNGAGGPVSACSGLICGIINKGKTTGQAIVANPNGANGAGSVQCQCDPTTTAAAASGTCTRVSTVSPTTGL